LPTHSDTDLALELAGFCAAHGVWCIADGETLIPILAFQRGHSEQRELTRFEADRLEEGVAKGKQWVTDNPEDVVRAVLVYDAFIPLPDGKTDCLVLEVHSYRPTKWRVTIGVPYRQHRRRVGSQSIVRSFQ
jgi:hypothetical protein